MSFTQEKYEQMRQSLGVSEENSTSERLARHRLLAAQREKTKQGRLSETWGDIKQMGLDIKSRFTEAADEVPDIKIAKAKDEQGNLRSGWQAFGAGAGAATASIGDMFMGLGKMALSQEQEDAVKKKVEDTAVAVMENPAIDWTVKQYVKAYKESAPEIQRDLKAAFNTAMLTLDVFGAEGARQSIKKIIDTGMDVMKKSTSIASEGIDATKEAATNIIKEGKDVLTGKPPTPLGAAGQILQGKTKDIKSGIQTIAEISTEGVKTFDDLAKNIKNKIGKLAKEVDADLGIDKAKRKLKDLVVEAKTVGGKIIKDNPVKTAIEHLEELYTKIGDKVEAANIKELLARAKKEGLTNLEINQLARDYGIEFSSKAFNKMGDALTSINAKLYENTRTALKDLARQGIKGEVAKLADKTMSALYNTEKLIQKNVEAVNKLQQKIKNAGLLEKVGNKITKYANVLSGGSIRGMIGGLLPRGAGYKVMNALDLEELLQRNLKIIKDAIESNSDDAIMKILNKLDDTDPKGKGEIPKTINKAYGVVAGVEVDEDGNITFNPVSAIAGMTALGITSKSAKIKELESSFAKLSERISQTTNKIAIKQLEKAKKGISDLIWDIRNNEKGFAKLPGKPKPITGYHVPGDEEAKSAILKNGFSFKQFGRAGTSEVGDAKGIYFFPSKSIIKGTDGWAGLAENVGVIKSELHLEKPFIIKSQKDVEKYFKEVVVPATKTKADDIIEFYMDAPSGSSEKITKKLKELGYDSIIDKDGILNEGYMDALGGFSEPQIIVLDLNKIKKNKELYAAMLAVSGASLLNE